MIRPLQIVTPTHPAALAAYLVAALIGVASLCGLSEQKALEHIMGPLVPLWAASMTVSALTGLVTSLCAKAWSQERSLTGFMRVEAMACAGLAVTMALYLASLLLGYPLLSSLTTKILLAGFVGGSAARCWQLVREQARIARASQHPRGANPAPLADPDDTD